MRNDIARVACLSLLVACHAHDAEDVDGSAHVEDLGPSADAPVEVDATTPAPEVIVPRTGIEPGEMAVLVNDDDALSVSVAAYYVTARGIPAENVVHLHVGTPGAALAVSAFTPLKTQVDAALAKTKAQAMAITWTQPYVVDYMSITSAFSLGYIPQDATTNACSNMTPKCGPDNPYALHPESTSPFTDLQFRPAMTIPATTLAEAQALIDRGVASDDTWPTGTAYLMDTSDQTRSARCVLAPASGYIDECQLFLNTWDVTASGIGASIVMADDVTNKTDVLFYVEGLASVPGLATNEYLPGAIADHLTSYGGQIPTSDQMSCFAFIQAGATGSFGTVVEPYAYQQKFPDPRVVIPRYFGGNTLIEAYWKSVVVTGQGIFIGEPLARPFGTGFRTSFSNGTLTIETTTMIPGQTYVVEAADASAGPFSPVLADQMVTKYGKTTLTIPDATRHTYRFR